jgi:YVTN family beta-propeller protein
MLVTPGMTLALNSQPAVGAQFLAYVADEGSDNVSVIDTLTDTVVDTIVADTIEVGDSPAGVAIPPWVIK